MSIKQRLAAIKNNIRLAQQQSSLSAKKIELIAVTKTQSVAVIADAIAAGHRVFGENYLKEALPKITYFKLAALEWHFIGLIQANKTRLLAENFAWVHSVSRLNIAQRLNEQRSAELPPLNICLQVKLDNDPQKAGLKPTELPALVQAIATMPQLRLRGLMTLPHVSSASYTAGIFSQLKQLYDDLQQQGCLIDTLSIGMSQDYLQAIAAGATHVRIGSAIFGAR